MQVIAAFAFIVTNAQVKFEALTFSPQFPKAGQTVNFKYNAQLSPLIDEKKVDVVVYFFTKKNTIKVIEPAVTKNGKVFSGQFKVDTAAACIAFGFSYEKEKDANNGNGYIIPAYNNENKPVKEYYRSASSLTGGLGEYYLGMLSDNQKALALLEEGVTKYPELKSQPFFLGYYLNQLNIVKKKEAKDITLAELTAFEKKGNLTEEGYNTLIQWHGREKRKSKVDSLKTAMEAAFPNGNWKQNEAGMSIYRESDPAKKQELFQDYITKYPLTNENKGLINNFKSQLANAFANAKDYKSFDDWNKQLDTVIRASNYNNVSWNMAEKDINLQEARKMSEFATFYAKSEMQQPGGKRPEALTKKQWDEQPEKTPMPCMPTRMHISFINWATTKRVILMQKKLPPLIKIKIAEYNERYAQLLEKVMPAATAQKEIEQFVRDGAASSKTRRHTETALYQSKKIGGRL